MSRPHRGAVCSSEDPDRSCVARWNALVQKVFIWQDYVGWLWLTSSDPNAPWDFCPWCGETLPTITEEGDPLEDVRHADGWDGEDGG